jgi:hypothetical protein
MEITLPDSTDLPPLTADGISHCPSPFPKAVQLMLHAGRIADLLNRPARNPYLVQQLQEQLLSFHRTLPDHQVWSLDNFNKHAEAHQAVSDHFQPLGRISIAISLFGLEADTLRRVPFCFCTYGVRCLSSQVRSNTECIAHATLALLQQGVSGSDTSTAPAAVTPPNSLSLRCARVICDRIVTGTLVGETIQGVFGALLTS